MDHGHLHHMHTSSVGVDPSIASGSNDRFPQWSVQETRDLLMIRSELDPTFMETKRNKLLWEVISTKMKEMGHNRSAEQCKAKWKNLVTRYKGCETMEHDGMRQQFPFYNDLQAIFSARIQRMLWMEAEGVASGSKKRVMQLSSDDDDDDDKEEISDPEKTTSTGAKNKKKKVVKSGTVIKNPSGTISNNTKEMLEEFMNQQMQMDLQWLKTFEAKEEERRSKEMEWRQTMEALENERMMLDQRWREREEQRMMRDEVRSEKRDALITALLNKLKRQDM
ncbi:trihelix transcription factor GT-3b [Cynara cardunculus var. scolymus]|uniref:Myb-like domain-containing protein n=1 Tax=Cynara cardunculus var. scolymus TaxID=59895 RepID=A0A103YLU9_CYNCS|nr:trihelix transcription factor GT-3b [Cynara cardunculus var. scolymus]KVI11438.1 Myb-like domain-containing protein [Cynara cardunculus var. scolymus]